MICFVGQTGAGKSNGLVELLSRKNDSFYKIIYFTSSTADEPLIKFLQQKIEGIEILDTPENLPELESFNDEDKKTEKLIIFNDLINLNKKQLAKVSKFYCSTRKYGFTCICMSQNYTEIPLNIRRNAQFFFLYKMSDLNTINHILKTHNMNNVNKNDLKNAYVQITSQPRNFMLIDLTTNSPMPFRKNFLEPIKLNNILK